MIDTTALHAADPARDLRPDADSAAAQALLSRIVAEPRRGQRPRGHRVTSRPLRRIAIGGAVAATGAAVLVAAPWNNGGAGTSAAAYAVTTGGDGAVHVRVNWNQLSDPSALQAALDDAGARVRVIVQEAGTPPCALPGPVAYSRHAVQWDSPGTATGGFTVRPADFPAGATFVLTVTMAPAGSPGRSTFAPAQPQLEGFAASMVTGPLPACAS